VVKSARLQQDLTVAVGAEEALALFTPVGERRWVDGWDPVFPAGEQGDGAQAGTVFTTEHDGHSTFWTVVDRDARMVRYARTTPGHWAGIVAVRCDDAGPGTTRATVTYELTALSAKGEQALAQFAREYRTYIGEWERLLAAMLRA
jgi:hypothetical protein